MRELGERELRVVGWQGGGRVGFKEVFLGLSDFKGTAEHVGKS